jgi:hypothetical protein
MGRGEEEAMALFIQLFEGDGLTADVVRTAHKAEREVWEAQGVRHSDALMALWFSELHIREILTRRPDHMRHRMSPP